MPRAIIFDLDGTLTASKAALETSMGALLAKLSHQIPIAITSGASLTQFKEQVVARLPADAELQNVYLLPTSGAALYFWNGSDWQSAYQETLTEVQMAGAERAIEKAIAELKMDLPPAYGARVERRQDTQVAFSGVGQRAPIAEKQKWDPDQKKRRTMVEIIKPELPWAEVKMGGMTTIDITRKGIDKLYGATKLAERLGLTLTDLLYVGDALYPGGNDEVMLGSSAKVEAVTSLADTKKLIESLLSH
ncbi:HAD-IIB family hydrolase [Candidatus Kaiserbacteria bacterium]|nr:HAD-IIB family hydrolase [Candidatus Kaiserbacteria bacterium]